ARARPASGAATTSVSSAAGILSTLTVGVIAPSIVAPTERARMETTIRSGAEWKPQTPDGFTDVTYDTCAISDGSAIAKITICRPEVRNAFRPRTLFELRDAFEIARDDPEVGVIILTGQGDEAFCSGGDQRIRGDDGYRDEKGIGRLNVLDLQVQIRR